MLFIQAKALKCIIKGRMKVHTVSVLSHFVERTDVNKVLKTTKKMFTITSFSANSSCSLIVNLKLNIKL